MRRLRLASAVEPQVDHPAALVRSADVAATACSGKPRRSSAMTPSVTCTKRSRTSPSHAHTVSAAQEPAAGAAHVDAQRREGDLDAEAAVREHAVAGGRGAHGSVVSTAGRVTR